VSLARDVRAVAERVDARLAASTWSDVGAAQDSRQPELDAAAEVAVFALRLAGKRRQARRGGRFGRLVVRFALAACVALASVAAACDKPTASPEATAEAISQLPSATGFTASITAQPRASPAQYTDLLLLDAGSDTQPWAVLVSKGGDIPILVDRTGSALDTVGGVYRLAARPVPVGTRDGTSQFLDALEPAVSTGNNLQAAVPARDQLVQRWSQDERFLAPTRAIAGQPTVLDAAYNAAAAESGGGTHTYLNGVVLRVEPDQSVVQVIDRALLESGRPTRAEDVVYVAVRAGERSLYEPGQVVNLRDVVMDRRTTDVDGQSTTVYVANAALDGARVEPTGRIDLQALLQPRLQRVDQDLAVQAQELGGVSAPLTPGAAPQPTATPGGTTPIQPPVVVNRYAGPSFVDDFLIWMWLSHSGFYRGPSVIINNPPSSPGRPGGDVYYSAPPGPSGSTPSTIASSQAASRSTALESARTSVSGQASGTGGGGAATNKSAADTSARVSAATAKSASVAGEVSASSAGKSIASAPSGSSTTASRSSGSTSSGVRGGSSASAGRGVGSAGSGSSGGFGGKGVGGSGSSSS
jgi:hypothetical protein